MFLALACSPPAVRVAAVEDVGVLETTSAVKARDGGYSGTIQGRSVWVYGDTILSVTGEDGSAWRNNSWSWTTDFGFPQTFSEPVDALGAPYELLPQTDEEAAYNADHRDDGSGNCEDPCGAREALWPADVVETDAGTLVFYGKIHGEPGAWNFYGLGNGVAVWNDFTTGPTRPESNIVDGEPTLLFGPDDPGFGTAVALSDGLLYAWGSRDESGGKQMRLGRVAPASVNDRSAWSFWDGTGWNADLATAATTFIGSSQMKISFDADLDTWLAVYKDEPWNELVYRTAAAPEGPWSNEAHLADALAPDGDGWAYCGIDHPEYRHDGVHLVSYYRSTGDWTGEIRLVQVTFERR